MKNHKSGFVSIVGSPNVGKSTLMNKLLGEKLSIVTSKAQTTRHRIRGILNHPDYQIVFSDTPGVVNAAYELHDTMMSYVSTSLSDADVLLFITDVFEDTLNHKATLQKIKDMRIPIICLINKMDLRSQDVVAERIDYWTKELPNAKILPISALHNFNVDPILQLILSHLPNSPAYFDKDAISDRPMRFFISEIIREKIFLNLKKEVPYACQVEVTDYEEEEDIIRIRANIIVERDSQKGIIIGAKGRQLKHIGIDSRKDIEKFVDKHVFLQTFVKVDKDWRSNEGKLKKYGY
ncbi:GTPase Era [Brumimicrobium salinarum]|uniref:GTPase Era n=1 Tax=Brumimicrobium salinarum TaxID=2058658 RepID=A0A2I0R3P7_9FLAO|nr:GTPase Era [Brumimicrobium salinarum]PKR81206.1 GTPase Era [Brumimicrobium salinarum]